jgi:hypothetical protein
MPVRGCKTTDNSVHFKKATLKSYPKWRDYTWLYFYYRINTPNSSKCFRMAVSSRE